MLMRRSPGAELVPDQALQPVERIDHDRLEVVLLAAQLAQRRDHVVVGRGQWKAVGCRSCAWPAYF